MDCALSDDIPDHDRHCFVSNSDLANSTGLPMLVYHLLARSQILMHKEFLFSPIALLDLHITKHHFSDLHNHFHSKKQHHGYYDQNEMQGKSIGESIQYAFGARLVQLQVLQEIFRVYFSVYSLYHFEDPSCGVPLCRLKG